MATEDSVRQQWFAAARSGDSRTLGELLSAHPALLSARDGTPLAETALHLAAEYGHLESVELLVAAGAPVNATTTCDDTPTAFARIAGHTEIEEYLIMRGGTEYN